jgi:DNA-directed RNA polymerase subunit RPC12/RpoP
MTKITLDCTKCGGALEITEGTELFQCTYCGTPYLVERSEGSVRVVRLEERVDQLEADQHVMRVDVARVELEQLLTGRKEMEEAFKQQRTQGGSGLFVLPVALGVPTAVFIMLAIGGPPDMRSTSLCFTVIGAIATVGTLALAIGRYRKKYVLPYRQAMEASYKREAQLRALIKRSGGGTE